MNDEANNSQAAAPKDTQTESPVQRAPQTSKRSIRIAGLKIAGVGAAISLFMMTSGAMVWLHKWATDLPGILGIVGLIVYAGLLVTGPVMFISGLFQAVSGYDVEKWWNK
jgi:TRAP-type C4-dicarboxylate transport system permease small subunit